MLSVSMKNSMHDVIWIN